MKDFVKYVAGFVFDPTRESVVMVRKNRPTWQAGKLNAVGGKIKEKENVLDAMRREFREEAGVDISSWEPVADLWGNQGVVYFYRATADISKVTTIEDEQIEIHEVVSFPYAQAIPNLGWLLPLAAYAHSIYHPVVVTEMEQ